MPTKGNESGIRLVISSDGLTAELLIGAKAEELNVDTESAGSLLFEAGVEVDDDVQAAVNEAVESWVPGVEVRRTICRGIPPKHGVSGSVEWDPEVLGEQAAGEEAGSETGDGEESAVSFYDRCAFVFVKGGQEIGRIIPPEDGQDGVDVCGGALPAKQARPASLQVDESIAVEEDGRMIAQIDGVLSRSRDKAAIKQYLELPKGVDFSTGNIDFDGDVKVINGVCDRFRVAATGNIEVSGLIGCSEIRADGTVFSSGGMAGRDEGTMCAGGDLNIRYLDSTTVRVGGTLRIEREAINCSIDVNGSVDSAHASLIGGELMCIGKVEVSALGSDAGTPTTIVVGAVPALERRLDRLDTIAERLTERKETLAKQIDDLDSPGRVMDFDEEEERASMSVELDSLTDLLDRAAVCRDSARDRIASLTTVDVRVMKALYAGTSVVRGNQRMTVRETTNGPLRITCDKRGELVYRIGDHGGVVPLRSVSEVQAIDAEAA